MVGITAVRDKLHPFAIGNGTVGKRMPGQHRFMPRPFAIKSKSAIVMPQPCRSALSFHPDDRTRHGRGHGRGAFPQRRLQRVLRKKVLDIGKRSEERREGTECVSTFRSRWSPCY